MFGISYVRGFLKSVRVIADKPASSTKSCFYSTLIVRFKIARIPSLKTFPPINIKQ